MNDGNRIRHVQTSELSKLIKSLPNKKAPGIDGISFEHLKFGGQLLVDHLCNLFNLILEKCVTPMSWKCSVVIPLYKGGNKSKTDVNSYRGISLLPSICKLFEKLLDNRVDDKLENFPNPQQVAYQKQLCSMFASFDLQETVHHYIERNSTVIVTFLDSTRAFDTVDHDCLKVKLYEFGVTGKLWTLLDNMYWNLKSCVRCNGILSRYFDLNRGVRQGSSLSSKLYLIYINELIDLVSASGMGAVVLDIQSGCPVQADDIALIASNETYMQSLINICYEYSQQWKFKFSQAKSQVMVFSTRAIRTDLKLNHVGIPVCNSVKHVGITINDKFNSMDRTIAACRTIRSLSMSVIRLGIHPSVLNLVTCSKIIMNLCYSKALYGCELWNGLKESEYLLLERAHRYVCKYLQGLPQRARTDKCTSLLGWSSITSIINLK